MPGIKHLVECHCYLAIYKNNKKIINHRFPVYSKIDEFGNIIPKIVKCNNCEAFHHVIDVNKTELKAGKDQSTIVLNKQEIATMLPDRIRNILDETDSDISNYEHALDIIEERRWGEPIVIKREIIGEIEQVKIIEILGKENIKIFVERINNLAMRGG